MIRASVSDLRKSLVAADAMAKAGIRFIPMPVFDDADNDALAEEMRRRLEKMEKMCEEGKDA